MAHTAGMGWCVTGFAAVNPGTGAVTVRLPQTYTDAKGNRVSGDYSLPAHSGMVFTT